MSNFNDSSFVRTQMCQFCGYRPRYYDEKIGMLGPFCGKACASEGAREAHCEHCQQRQKYGSQSFCGQECAAASVRRRFLICAYKGCTKQPAIYPIGTYWNYCSAAHEGLARGGCIYCRGGPTVANLSLCSRCHLFLADFGPLLLPLPKDHDTYWNVHNQFINSWAHPTGGGRAEVRMVYRILPARGVWSNFWTYQDLVDRIGTFSEQGKRSGNLSSLWHGTFRACRLGEPGRDVFCTSPDCSLCLIAQGSFKLASANTSAFQRFGLGIYTSSNSSKSDTYSKNKFESPWKAVLLNSVITGTVYETMYSAPHFTGAPRGYGSVRGIPGGDLNYDELVVYTDDAIRPTHIVMYELVSN